MSTPALHPYRVRCAGLEYTTRATGACAAIAEAIRLHGVPGATAKPLRRQGGAA